LPEPAAAFCFSIKILFHEFFFNTLGRHAQLSAVALRRNVSVYIRRGAPAFSVRQTFRPRGCRNCTAPVTGKPRGFISKPCGFIPEPQGFISKPQGFTLKPRGFNLKLQGFISEPRGFILKPQGFMAKPHGSIPEPHGFRPRMHRSVRRIHPPAAPAQNRYTRIIYF
jgi:hypothetical protein